jgi:hypothetical protein
LVGFPAKKWTLKFKAMCTFIEDYLQSPAQAIQNAQIQSKSRFDGIDENLIYSQMESSEFRLYETIVLY